MNCSTTTEPVGGESAHADRAAVPAAHGDILVRVEWRGALFLNYEMDPALLRAEVPRTFELELHDGKAIVSVVALTMRRFRAHPRGPFWAHCFSVLPEQRFLNLRTYVRHGHETGAFFFWSWLSRPWGMPLPARPFGLTCEFAASCYRLEDRNGRLDGAVEARRGRFSYRARLNKGETFTPCERGSLAEFALERYSGFFWHRRAGRVFRVQHPPWVQAPVEATIEDPLVGRVLPWFNNARFVSACFAPGFNDVLIGPPCPLDRVQPRRRTHRAFLEFP